MTRQSLTIFWEHTIRYKGEVVLIVAGVTLGVLADTLIPLYYKKIIDLMSQGAGSAEIFPNIWMILGLGGTLWVGFRISTFVNNHLQPRVMSDLLNTCFAYLHNHSYSFFTGNFTGSLVKKVTRYSRAYEEITDQIFWNMGPVVLRLVIILVILYFRHWILALILLLWSLAYVGFNYGYSRFKLKYDVTNAEADTKTGAHLADTVSNNINIKLFSGLDSEYQQHKSLTQKLFWARKIAWDLGAFSETIQSGLMVGLEVAIIFVAVKFWQRGLLTVGDFALLQAFLLQIFGRLWEFGRYLRRIYERLADAEEMTEILVKPHEVVDFPGAKKISVRQGKIEFIKVAFQYHSDVPVFENFNMIVAAGQRVALIGPSGGGKSTFVRLLLRFHDLTAGKILIDGQDISQVTQESLRNAIALVPQEPILFHRTLSENIRYARPQASKQEITRAAKLAHCHEFISHFPHQYDTYVGERGVKLSGGERQRVAIARAILKNSPILVLDEATSSLDSESEYYIQDALKNLMAGRTTIVIAHRLSTIMQMDRIVVIDEGKIIEEGKHRELLKVKKGIYQKLWQIQAGGFEQSRETGGFA
ncbi:MAG: ABC transporter ATP-binding protein [Candidatus Doudnabacteria bacterium]|nr:ABC transporter ATP-binding protein [Candidatus Doudnabacteria bacterium]